MSEKPETARECAERLCGVRWTPKSAWPTEVEFLTGNLVDAITSALEEREREIQRLRAKVDAYDGYIADQAPPQQASDEQLSEAVKLIDMTAFTLSEWVDAIQNKGTSWDDWDEYYKDVAYQEGTRPGILKLLNEFLARVKGSPIQSDPIKDLCDLLKEKNMGFVFWVCDNPEHRRVTWEHNKEGSVATCEVCGKKSVVLPPPLNCGSAAAGESTTEGTLAAFRVILSHGPPELPAGGDEAPTANPTVEPPRQGPEGSTPSGPASLIYCPNCGTLAGIGGAS